MPRGAGTYDLGIIGGGINGCGIARDAAGRGLRVILAEEDDLARATSSASTKLIHGGLRYLEYFEFRLVREALIEREVLLRAAPHIIRPLRFVLPHHKGLRPWPILRFGLFLYDHLGGRKFLPPTRVVDLSRDPAGEPLKPIYARGFEYSDCWVDDARLAVLTARDAAERGAEIRVRTRCVSARREGGLWRVVIEHAASGLKETVGVKTLVNTAGPWVSEVMGSVIGIKRPDRIRLVKGSHLVLDKLYDHDRCYTFQNADQRICFAIPYEDDFTLIGTTDEDYQGDLAHPSISDAERDYLLDAVGAYFKRPVTRDMVRWSYAGVRPLHDDGASRAQDATREYELMLDAPAGQAPLLSVIGGKITTYRRLAEAVMAKLAPFFPTLGPSWTADAPLPGGDFPFAEVERHIAEFGSRHPFLSPPDACRLFRAYGTRAERIVDGVSAAEAMGRRFGPLSEREIDYLIRQEWARSADDILWRRSKLGLRLDQAQRSALSSYLAQRGLDAPAARPTPAEG